MEVEEIKEEDIQAEFFLKLKKNKKTATKLIKSQRENTIQMTMVMKNRINILIAMIMN